MYRSLVKDPPEPFQIIFLAFEIFCIFKSLYLKLSLLSEAETVSLVRKGPSPHLPPLPTALPGQLADIVPPACPGSATRSPPGLDMRETPCQEDTQVASSPDAGATKCPGCSRHRGAAPLLWLNKLPTLSESQTTLRRKTKLILAHL